MSKGPIGYFYRLTGRANTVGAFVTNNGLQESVTGEGSILSNSSYHSKIYSLDDPITMKLSAGLPQDGTLKRITFVHKGTPRSNITIKCPTLNGSNTQIIFNDVGDCCELMWNGSSWTILSTLNFSNPASRYPMVV